MGLFKKTCLGIDIGMSSLKVVALSSFGKKVKLENYAGFEFSLKQGYRGLFHKEGGDLLTEETSVLLHSLLDKAHIKPAKIAFSLPSFFTFFTTFDLPPMTEQEVPRAVEFEAYHHIPLPPADVTFDWRVLKKQEVREGVKMKILLVAVPNKLLQSYQRLAALLDLEVVGMEAGVFGLVRSAIPQTLAQDIVCLVDIGWEVLTVSIVNKGILQLNRSFEISADDFVRALSNNLGLEMEKAEDFLRDHGLDPGNKRAFQALVPIIDTIGDRIQETCNSFWVGDRVGDRVGDKGSQESISQVVLCGGMASLLGLDCYLEAALQKKILRADPFQKVEAPSALETRLKQLGPSFGVALGAALRVVRH